MRERRPMLFLGLSVVLALLTGVVMYGATQRVAARAATSTETAETGTVLVARADIPAQTLITAELVDVREHAADTIPAAALRDRAKAVGLTTLAPIPQGAVLLASQLVEAKGVAGASAALEPGKVLVAFPATDALSAAGFVKAGDHVDILATLAAPDGKTAEAPRVTQTIVQDLQVVEVSASKDGRGALLVFVVDHQTALVLKHLRDAQTLVDLVVRSRRETDKAATTSVDSLYLVQRYGLRPR